MSAESLKKENFFFEKYEFKTFCNYVKYLFIQNLIVYTYYCMNQQKINKLFKLTKIL